MIDKNLWRWYENAGHFCGASQCRFHLCTEIGDYLISTVGEWHPDPNKEKRTIGGGTLDFYETYVFKTTGERCACGCELPDIHLSEVTGVRYATPGEANKGHLELCEEYSLLDPKGEEGGENHGKNM